jgi:hypothetical protein
LRSGRYARLCRRPHADRGDQRQRRQPRHRRRSARHPGAGGRTGHAGNHDRVAWRHVRLHHKRENRDPRKNGESADGLAIKEGSGSGNVVRGARLWNNSDDGFDAWLFTSPILIENSAAWGNGVNRRNVPSYVGDGNGFKMGGGDPDPPANHTIRNSFAFQNAVGGIIDNGNPGTIVVDRNTAWRNGDAGFKFPDSTSRLTANLALNNGAGVSLGTGVTATGNSWNIKPSWTAADVASTDPSTLTGPRNTDGSIRASSFLRPTSYSNLGARI